MLLGLGLWHGGAVGEGDAALADGPADVVVDAYHRRLMHPECILAHVGLGGRETGFGREDGVERPAADDGDAVLGVGVIGVAGLAAAKEEVVAQGVAGSAIDESGTDRDIRVDFCL